MTLWLVGLMGSGKTSAGARAASSLGVDFYDTDHLVAERMGCSIAQMWGELGEAAFRDLERVVTSAVAGRVGIVATGGGVVLDDENRAVMTGSGRVIWLRADPSVLADRIGPSPDRPLIAETGTEAALAEQLVERGPLYAQVASFDIDTNDLDVLEVSDLIEAVWNA